MIRPIEVAYPALKLFFTIGSLTDIEHFVLFGMIMIHKANDLNACKHYYKSGLDVCTYFVDVVSPVCLFSDGWVAHDDNPILTDVGKINVEAILLKSSSSSTNKFPKHFRYLKIYYNYINL